jgi:hypothetical protein
MTKLRRRLLTEDARIRKAVKIIKETRGEQAGDCTEFIGEKLRWLDTHHALVEITRGIDSAREKKKWAAWLDRGVQLFDSLHSGPPGFEKFHHDAEQWVQSERRRIWVVPGAPKMTATDKLAAAEAALHLCDRAGIEPATTKAAKGGTFCKLAAVLWGDETADLQKYCQSVLEPGYLMVPPRQKSAKSRPKIARVRR